MSDTTVLQNKETKLKNGYQGLAQKVAPNQKWINNIDQARSRIIAPSLQLSVAFFMDLFSWADKTFIWDF